MSYNYSEKTMRLIRERNDLKAQPCKRSERNKRKKEVFFKDMIILGSKTIDSFKSPVTCVLTLLLIANAGYIVADQYYENKETAKFFTSLENDSTIPKQTLIKIQQHYYRAK